MIGGSMRIRGHSIGASSFSLAAVLISNPEKRRNVVHYA
jgi:hypothetical protein